MGCSNSKSTTAMDERKAAKDNKKMCEPPKQEYPASEAFTIPLDDDANNADIPLNDTLRQPPKRLQQLMQQAAETEPLTLEELEDKQQRAEQRRQELLQQKVESIQKNTQMLMRVGHEEQEQEQQLEQEQERKGEQEQQKSTKN